MNWTTPVEIPKSDIRIDWKSNVAFIGSCFAENISHKFTDLCFRTAVNPFGIVYNPLSVANMLKRIANKKLYTADEIFFDGENYHCWDFHGSFSSKDSNLCLQQMNGAVESEHAFLQKADVVFLTLGSAFCYFLQESGTVVSNCHRQNANLFRRELVSVERIVFALESAVQSLQTLNPQVRIVLTVSPLRHFKDGAHGNQLSKATLLLSANSVANTFKNVEYFPSYEIAMDELRDYRFYAADMIHLSSTAEDYIFEKCGESYFSEETRRNLSRVESFLKLSNHRIFDADSFKVKTFAQYALLQAKDLQAQIPGLDLSAEIRRFESFI